MLSLSPDTQELLVRANRAIGHSARLQADRTLISAETRRRVLMLEMTLKQMTPRAGIRHGSPTA
jgi:hypothetical protein